MAELRPTSVMHPTPFAVGWQARWIWNRRPPVSVNASLDPIIDREAARGWSLFRRTFSLTSVPAVVPARVTADSRYAVWVNEIEVGRGPVRGNPQRLHYDTYDLAPFLRSGPNVIAVCARHYGAPTPWWMPAMPTFGLGGGAFAFEARLADGWLATGRTWRALDPGAWDDQPGVGLSALGPECLDARLLPAAWRSIDYDDTSWANATELTANYVGFQNRHELPTHPYGAPLPRPIPMLGGSTHGGQVVAAGSISATPGPLDSDPVVQARHDQRDATLDATGASLPFGVAGNEDTCSIIIIDMGQQVSGLVGVVLSAAAGTRLDVQLAEALTPEHTLQAEQQHSGFRYVARGHDDAFETFDRLGFRYAALSVRSTAEVTIDSFTVREQLLPRDTETARVGSAARGPDRGSVDSSRPPAPYFRCDDPLLEQIWRVGRRTVDLCSHDAYLDCPSREQRAWTGDFAVSQLVDLTTNPDWSLARWHVDLAASPRPDGMLPMAPGGDFETNDRTFIPDWALHWVHALWNLWWYTGDTDAVRRNLPVAERVLQWFEPFVGTDGLAEHVTGWILIDWSAVHTAGTSGALNALWARALREFAELADAVGDAGRASWARARWQAIDAGFEQLWDADRGLYVDHCIDGVAQRPLSQHTNAAAIVAGLVPRERQASILQTILDPSRIEHAAWLHPGVPATLAGVGPAGDMYANSTYLVGGMPEAWWDVEHGVVAAQPFFRSVVHDAVAVAGLAARIPELCREWAVLLERCPTSWSETWYGGSHCHAWCATPTSDLMRHTLGVTPSTPGYERVRIAPALGNLREVHGALPTPLGPIIVDATRTEISVTSPVPGTVHTIDGAIEIAPGTHSLAAPAT